MRNHLEDHKVTKDHLITSYGLTKGLISLVPTPTSRALARAGLLRI